MNRRVLLAGAIGAMFGAAPAKPATKLVRKRSGLRLVRMGPPTVISWVYLDDVTNQLRTLENGPLFTATR